MTRCAKSKHLRAYRPRKETTALWRPFRNHNDTRRQCILRFGGLQRLDFTGYALANLGSMLRYAGRAKEAAAVLERAVRLDPFHPPNYLEWLGDAYLFLGRYQECVQAVERGVALDPEFVALRVTAAGCYAALGDEKKAREAGVNILRVNPSFTIKAFASYVPFTEQSDLELKVKLLQIAGVPE